MYSHRIATPGLTSENFDSFGSDDESSDPFGVGHAIFEYSGYAYACELPSDLFQGHISTVSHVLNQPQCHRWAKFLTWIRMLHMNKAKFDRSVPGSNQTSTQSINQIMRRLMETLKSGTICLGEALLRLSRQST